MQKIKLKNQDFERYRFPFYVSKSFGKQRKRYIVSELEQRHPCFSEDFSFDAGIGLDKKKLCFDVIVINRLKLMEYKRKCNFRNAFVYAGDSLLPRFVSERFKRIVLIVLLSGLVLVLGLKWKFKGKNICVNSEVQQENAVFDGKVFAEAGELTERFLSLVAEGSGKISALTWGSDGYTERLSASVEGLFPEQLCGLGTKEEISIVSYSRGNPVFNYSVFERISVSQKKEVLCSDELVHSELREFFRKNKMIIQEESFSPFSVRFCFECITSEFEELDSICRKFDLGIAEVSLNCNEAGDSSMELLFSQEIGFDGGVRTGVLSLCPEVFKCKKKVVKKKTENIKNSSLSTEKSLGMKKIGEVNYTDGKVCVFYKNAEGKLIKKIEEKK